MVALSQQQQSLSGSVAGPELTVVIPCYNERANVPVLARKLADALHGIAWEAVFVDDDSPDGTAAEVRRIARTDPRVRCVQRIGRRGLASAVVEGALSSSADMVAVIDGDLQHDETRLPAMLALLRDGTADLVVASRYVAGGDAGGLANASRARLSRWGIDLAQRMTGVRLTDPMSGFFMLPRSLFERLAPRLSAQGFKILLDIVLSSPERLRVTEIPAVFRERVAGESKLNIQVLVQFAALLIDKATGGVLPMRFISFGLVGAFGVLVNLVVLNVGRAAGLPFSTAQIAGTLVAMLGNFQLNNSVTYRDVRLRGPALWRGGALFMAVCCFGAVANIGIARTLYHDSFGWTPAGAIGAAIGVVWNYAVSATLVWRRR